MDDVLGEHAKKDMGVDSTVEVMTNNTYFEVDSSGQSDIVDKEWGGVPAHVDYVRYVKTDYTATADPAKPAIVWGGFKDGQPQGRTKAYLSKAFMKKTLTGVIAVGGGPIALEEAHFARSNGVPVEYVPAETRFPEANGPFGSLHESFARS